MRSVIPEWKSNNKKKKGSFSFLERTMILTQLLIQREQGMEEDNFKKKNLHPNVMSFIYSSLATVSYKSMILSGLDILS